MEAGEISSKSFEITPKKKFGMIKQTFTISKLMPSFKKYAPKYATNVDIIRDDCPKTTSPRLKYVRGFSFYIHGYSQTPHRLQKNQIFKIIKHHKKFIQSCAGIQLTPQYTKELPKLRSFEFYFSSSKVEEDYKMLTFCRALKSFYFDLNTQMELVAQIEKDGHKVRRALRNMRSIKEFSLRFHNQNMTSLFTSLQFFGSCPFFLSRLGIFDIDLSSGRQIDCEEDFQNDVNVRMVLRFITHLRMSENILFEKLIFDHELLGNLTNLTIKIKASKDFSEANVRKLSLIGLLPRLKHLDLDFTSGSKLKEKIFLESFSLPKNIETVKLTLRSFVWTDKKLSLTKENRTIIEGKFEKHPRFQRFYNEWASLNHLHTLELAISNRFSERECPSLTLKFATGVLKNLKSLKKLRYENFDDVFFDESSPNKIIPMDLGVLCRILKSSKNTLEELVVLAEPMNFFTKKDLQQEDLIACFKRLKRVYFHGEIYWARNFGDFLNLIVAKDKRISVHVDNLCFKEEKYLRDFFKNLLRIPKDLDVNLTVDVSRLVYSGWVESFCQFIAEIKVEGILKLRIIGASEEVEREESRIRASVEKNPAFEELTVRYKRQTGNYLFLKF